MGWASGGEVFDPVARTLVDYNVPDWVMRDVCKVLIIRLQDRDWDCEEESLGEFAEVPAIVQAFADCGIFLRSDPRHSDYGEDEDEL